MSSPLPAPRLKLSQTATGYLAGELTAILTLVAVAAFDIGSSQPDSAARLWLIVLHLLFFACFLGFGIIHRLRPVSGHLVIATFVVILLLLLAAGSSSTTQVVLLFVLSAYAHEALSEFAANLWVIAFGIASMLGFSLLLANPVTGTLIGLGTLGGYLFIGGAARNRRSAEEARAESQRLLQELQVAHEQLKQRAHEAEVLAAAEERNRVARELHDTLGHRLTVAAVQLEGAQRLITRDPGKATQMVAVVRSQILDGLAEVRQTVAALRTPLAADLTLPASIHLLANHYAAATGLQVETQISEQVQPYLDHLSRDARHTLFRTAQEGLTNVQKHANATSAWIQLDLTGASVPSVQIAIHDNGTGINGEEESNGFGLAGLAERAAQLNGAMHLQPSPYGGAMLQVSVPVEQSGYALTAEPAG